MYKDGFNEGIEPGGLREKSEIKLLICYLLKRLDRPVTKTRLNEIMQEHYLANYFEANQAISELLHSGQITADIGDDDELLTLTPAYSFTIATIEKSLPRSVREKAMEAALRLFARERSESENKVTIEPVGSGFNVTFTICDGETELMRLTVFVADEAQAQTVKRNFLEDPAGLYSGIISSLTID